MRTKITITGFLATLLAAFPTLAVHAADMDESERTKQIQSGPPSATLELEATQFRLLVGGGTGKGVLHFKGKDYPFTGKGFTGKGGSVGGVGYTEVSATGKVYFLGKLEDFADTYRAIGLGAGVVKGAGTSSWQNQKRVVLILTHKSKRLAPNMGLAAIIIELTPR